MEEGFIYEERVTSNWTEALFLLLALLFFAIFALRQAAGKTDAFIAVFFGLFVLFLFYTLNYRVLVIRMTDQVLALRFGIFSWRIPFDNVQACRLDDDLPALMKYGGAGIHFFTAHGRYRASFNFLEHPRVAIRFRRKAWLVVEDVSFTTRRPKEVIRLIREAISAEAPPVRG